MAMTANITSAYYLPADLNGLDSFMGNMIVSFIGGIGLFLLGMRLMTDGLKYSAGGALRNILARSTNTPLHGILTGAVITALVQSSGAITVAIIGFVNAGLMDLGQAITLVYGSNIGTTMTAWLVAAVGFKIDVKVLAMPAVGLGMLLRTIYAGRRLAGLGEAVAGFGIFFIGIGELTNAFGSLGATLHIERLAGAGSIHLFMFVAIGALLTFLMQSSSASIALALTAAIGGVIQLDSAAAMVIGANVGTTSTAVFATLDATSNARRIAAAHVIFNIVTGVVAILILPIILNNLHILQHHFGLKDDPGVILALFHTTFNVLGVLLFFPFTKGLVTSLGKRFRSYEEDASRPRYLDRTILTTPSLAIQALAKELGRVGTIALQMAKGAISSEGIAGKLLKTDKLILDRLIDAAASFSNQIQRTHLPPELDDLLPHAMRVSGYYTAVAELAMEIAEDPSALTQIGTAELAAHIDHFKGSVVKLLRAADTQNDSFSPDECSELFKQLQEEYQQLKSKLLRTGTKGEISARQMVSLLEKYSKIRRIADQAEKGALYLQGVLSQVAVGKPANVNEND